NIVAIRPLKDGVIADFDVTKEMLKYFISKASRGRGLVKPRIVICVPGGVTEVEKKAVEDAALNAGAREAYLIEEPMAAAIGSGLSVEAPSGSMVVDIGGGTTEVAVIALGGIVTANSIRIGGDALDASIISYVKKEYSLLIGEMTAEKIKIDIGTAIPDNSLGFVEIKGRDLISGLPKTIKITAEDSYYALKENITDMLETIKQTLEKTPPELASDVIETGIYLTGGGAMLHNIDKLIADETGIKVIIADNPLDCVANGTGKALEDLHVLKKK
ncbi:MAG: rod shape-determining protein, partial [Tissierellia bacterium]|nr:rod shape-determining protein [Tissierellia bacterium]